MKIIAPKYKRLKSLIGERYGRILVLEKAEGRDETGYPLYRCVCDCGKEVFLGSNSLNHKKGTRSCGCGRKPYKHALSLGEASMRTRYAQYKSGAKKRGLVFELSLEDFHIITQGNCYYCNSVPKQSNCGSGSGRGNGNYIYNGIDRIDNSKGYTLDNCVPCCGVCNRAKRERSKEDFFEWIKLVYFNLFVEKT